MSAESTLGFWFILQFQLLCNLLPTCQHFGASLAIWGRFVDGGKFSKAESFLVNWDGREGTYEGKPGFHYVDETYRTSDAHHRREAEYVVYNSKYCNSRFRVVVYFFRTWLPEMVFFLIPGELLKWQNHWQNNLPICPASRLFGHPRFRVAFIRSCWCW